MVDRDDGSILYVFETVAHELYATKPSRYTDNTVANIVLLQYPQNDHPGASLTVVAFGFVDDAIMLDAGSKGVVGCSGVRLVLFEGLEKDLYVFSIMDKTVADTITTAAVFNDVRQ